MAMTTTCVGASGNSYLFEIYKLGVEFNPLPAIYALSTFRGETLLGQRIEALYVGQTKSLHERLNTNPMNHDGFKRSRNAGMTHIAVMLCHDAAERLRIETDLRHGLDPVCNRQPVPSTLRGLLTR